LFSLHVLHTYFVLSVNGRDVNRSHLFQNVCFIAHAVMSLVTFTITFGSVYWPNLTVPSR